MGGDHDRASGPLASAAGDCLTIRRRPSSACRGRIAGRRCAVGCPRGGEAHRRAVLHRRRLATLDCGGAGFAGAGAGDPAARAACRLVPRRDAGHVLVPHGWRRAGAARRRRRRRHPPWRCVRAVERPGRPRVGTLAAGDPDVVPDDGVGSAAVRRREGGAGPERLRVICGFLGCDALPFNPVLATLPRLLPVRRTLAAGGDRLAALVEFAVGESREKRAGSRSVLLRLGELMFVEVVRRHLDDAAGGAARLARGACAIRWSGAPWRGSTSSRADRGRSTSWRGRSATSRSVLAERFTHFVGEPPMHYLARWRMHLAATLLADNAAKVSAVAREVGYDSEAAFSRAFKKLTGVAPAPWRHRQAPTIATEESLVMPRFLRPAAHQRARPDDGRAVHGARARIGRHRRQRDSRGRRHRRRVRARPRPSTAAGAS